MLSQAILNLVDAAMVGHLGAAALAGVGIGGYANFFVTSLVIGLGSGVQAMTARRYGEGQHHQCADALHGGLLIALGLAILLIPTVRMVSTPFLTFISQDDAVLNSAIPYFDIRMLGILAVGLNFSFRGFWNAIDLSRIYMRTLVTMHCLNALLSYALIFGKWGLPALGVEGAAWGTTLSLYLGSVLYALSAWRHARGFGFCRVLPTWPLLRSVAQLSMPNSVQSLFFSAGLSAMFWIIGRIGSDEVAVAHALVTLLLFIILPAMGIGMAAATLVGQSLGRGEPEEAYHWAWRTIVVGVGVMLTIGLPMVLLPDLILGIFLHQPHLVDLGRLPLLLMGVLVANEAIVMILPQALLGAGASSLVMRITVLSQWGMFLPLAWLLGPQFGFGLLGVWIAQSLHRLLNSAIFIYHWQRRAWQVIQV